MAEGAVVPGVAMTDTAAAGAVVADHIPATAADIWAHDAIHQHHEQHGQLGQLGQLGQIGDHEPHQKGGTQTPSAPLRTHTSPPDAPLDGPPDAITSASASPLPTAFPKKRRGRPPGRPNATVRDADYEENPLVQAWNAAKNDRAVPVVSIDIRHALTESSLVHETQRAIFGMPSRETILFVQGWITAKHIASQRPSYVNGLLIHSRGQDAAVACAQCTEKRAKNALGPFLTCRVLPGSYHNSCSNCKWFDNTSTCSLYTGPKPNRKRKAKEQLPPAPAPGRAGPRSAPEGAQQHVGTAAVLGPGSDNSLPVSIPQSHIHPHLQPEADMALLQHDPGQPPPPALEPPTDQVGSGSPPDLPPYPEDIPSQPNPLPDSPFALDKVELGGPVREAEGDEEAYVQVNLQETYFAIC